MVNYQERLKQYESGIKELIDSQRQELRRMGIMESYIEAPINSVEKILLLERVLMDFYDKFPELKREDNPREKKI